jgi:hypothetical protein
MKSVSKILAFIILISITQTLLAERKVIWSCNAIGMTSTIASQSLLEYRSGKVFHKEDLIGKTILICPIDAVTKDLKNKTVKEITLTAKVQTLPVIIDGFNTVSAELRFINKSTGHVDTIKHAGTAIGGFTDEPDWKTRTSHQPDTVPNARINYKFDFDKNFYYIQVTMNRIKNGVLGVMGAELIGE